jgi:glyoxylase-like metal-dependent hydrolase (beta-lactamase superfamily II)
MIEVFPGIRWLKLPITMEQSDLEFVNVYLIEDGDGFLMVDTGWNTDASFSALHNALIKSGHNFQSIKQILITHIHPDHYGMAGRIRELSGATIAMHNMEKDLIQSRYVNMSELLHQTDRLMINNGVPEEEVVKLRNISIDVLNYVVPSQPDKILHTGDIITAGTFKFYVLWTPGHSSGHVCLFEPQKKVLLSGDHILPKITPNVSVNPQTIDNPLGRYMQSLEEIKELDVDITLPGHGEPFHHLKMRCNEILHHHRLRNAEILETISQNPHTIYNIATHIKWGNNNGDWQDLPPFHKRMAVLETLAHLEMLATDSRVDILPKKGIAYYKQRQTKAK